MGLTIDPRWRALQQTMLALARRDSSAQRTVLKPVTTRVRDQVQHQLTTGVGPDGRAQRRTKTGRTALVSRKIARTFKAIVVPLGVRVTSIISWLRAHHEGHVFPARKGRRNLLSYDRRGRLLSRARARRARFVFEVRARAHTVGRRVLPPTPIFPTGGALPAPWAKAVNEGALEGATELFTKLSG